jgi:DNA-binding NarL/FixJ family response regulator
MESLLFSQRLLDYLEQYKEIDMLIKREITKETLGIFGDFIYDVSVPDTWHLDDIERIDNRILVFHWVAKTDQAVCPECKTVSRNRVKTYLTRHIQDLPLSGKTVYHALKANRFYCDNPECASNTFIEQFDEIADKDARLSHRLKDFVVREAIESSCHGTSIALKRIGVTVSTDTINREVKKKGAIVVAQNLKRDDVKVLSVDDINLRKGNSSTACSVFIDAETHRVLVIVQGATGEITEKVIQHYPSAVMVSRDRGTAYAAAAKKSGKTQVADRFHLVQNIHQTIKEALSLEVARDLFIREGDGWIRMVDSAYEKPAADPSEQDNDDGLVVIKPATLAAEDIERRIHLAGLKTIQANKYKKTMEILELTESGLRTPEIAKRLSLKTLDVRNYRKNAPETIENVELKIDEYVKMQEQGQWEYHQKTIAKKARPSSESIVEPYKETVLRLFKDGENHRNIHPVIVKEGYSGSVNAVYQYLIKYAHENDIPYGRNSRVIPPEERNDDRVMSRPPRISIERASRNTIYESLLHAAATRKNELKQALLGLEAATNDSRNKNNQSTPAEWVNKTRYADNIAEIIFDTKPKDKHAKKN